MARILVTGGAGYIGSHCCRMLQKRGDDVVVLDDLSTGHAQAVQGELVVGDIRDAELVRRVMAGADGVVHFAAKALVAESFANPGLYESVNVVGTRRLAEAALQAGVGAFVFSSSCSIYGTPETTPVVEGAAKQPESPYGASKWAAEQLLVESPVPVARLRYFNAAGAHPDGTLGESHDPETHLIPLALDAVLGRRPPLKLFGRDYPTPDGTCVRDYVHVQDLASAHLAALDRMLAGGSGGAWNLGTGHGTSVLALLQAVERVTGRPVPYEDAPRRDGDPAAVWADVTAVRRDLAWEARYRDIDTLVADAWRWASSRPY